MRFILASLFILGTFQPAAAHDCADVRRWVQTYGLREAIALARAAGATTAQINLAIRTCLRR